MSKTLQWMITGLVGSLAVFLLVMQVPSLSVLLLLIPVVYIWLGFFLPPRMGYLAGSLFFILTTVLLDHPISILIGLFGGLIPVAMTLVARRDYLEDAVTKTIVMSYAGLLGIQYYLLNLYEIDLYQVYLSGLNRLIQEWRASGIDTDGLFSSLSGNYLSFVFIFATGLSLGLFGLAVLLRKWKLIRWQSQPFYTFKFRGLGFLQFGLIMLVIYGLSAMEAPYGMVGQNTMQFLMILFTIQGLSALYFFLKKRGFGNLTSFIVIGISMLMPLFNTVISLVGFSDSLFDFRKLEAMK